MSACARERTINQSQTSVSVWVLWKRNIQKKERKKEKADRKKREVECTLARVKKKDEKSNQFHSYTLTHYLWMQYFFPVQSVAFFAIVCECVCECVYLQHFVFLVLPFRMQHMWVCILFFIYLLFSLRVYSFPLPFAAEKKMLKGFSFRNISVIVAVVLVCSRSLPEKEW